jgi:hypothetical protein
MDPNTDIKILFESGLQFRSDPNYIEQKLRVCGITTIGQLLGLTATDLMHISIDGSDSEALIFNAR